jgi:hypothetical protein
MLILPEFLRPYIIDNYTSPILPKYFWIFSSAMFDFTLAPLTFIEENTSAVLKVEINGLELLIPYNWYILIADVETNQLDWVQINECAAIECSAFLMSPIDNSIRMSSIKILDIIPEYQSYYPVLQKTNALCHPVSKEISKDGTEFPLCIIIGPTDISKQVMNKYCGDLF